MLFIQGQKILDTIFPPRDSQLLIRNVKDLPKHPETKIFLNYPITFLGPYTSPKLHAAIIEGKYHNNKNAHFLLGKMLTDHIKNNVSHFDYIVPIPLSSQRQRSRGHNQIVSILHQTPHKAHSALKRTNNESQTFLNRPERIANVKDAFSTTSKAAALSGSHIILVDDVVTTGATLTAAAKELETIKPASLTLIALAH